MVNLFAGNKIKQLVWAQVGTFVLLALIFFGGFAIAQSDEQPTSTNQPRGSEAPALLVTASASPTPSIAEAEISDPSDEPKSGNQGYDINSTRIQEEYAQCKAAMESIINQIRSLSEITNSFDLQLQNFPSPPYDPNLTQEEQNAVWAAHEAQRQAIQVQRDAANANRIAYEMSSPMGDGSMGCGTGNGPYPQ